MQRAQRGIVWPCHADHGRRRTAVPAKSVRTVPKASSQAAAVVPKQRNTWAKPLAIVVSAVAAITAVALVFAYAILPNMDSSSDNSSVQIENPGTHDQDNDSPDSAITTSSVPSVENLAGSYSADGSSVQFTWVNPDPQDGDSYAWSLVGDAGVDPNAQGTTTTDTRISIKPADGSQTCIQGEPHPSGPADVAESCDRVRGQTISITILRNRTGQRHIFNRKRHIRTDHNDNRNIQGRARNGQTQERCQPIGAII